jgi:hypothetical protein
MGVIILGWSIVSFAYTKIAFDAFLPSEVSISAALMIGVLTGPFIFGMSGIYTGVLQRYLSFDGRFQGENSQLVGATIMPFLLGSAFYLIIVRLLVFGFSKGLNSELRAFDYNDHIRDPILWFIAVAVQPVLFHYLTIVFGMMRLERH